MAIGELCNRVVVVTEPTTSAVEAARLMREHHVGTLVVVERSDERSRPLGIVSDRDLVVEVLAPEVEAKSVTLADLTTQPLVTAREDEELWDVLDRMRSHGVRRMPVVDADGCLAGILAADDVVELFAEGLGDLAKLVKQEIRREEQTR